MIKTYFRYISILLISLSCSAEKINLSPIGNLTGEFGGENAIYNLNERRNLIVYSSEITNTLSSIPKFKSDVVNNEISRLKYHLKDYIGALEASNTQGLTTSHKNFEKSYKKLQHLRKNLNKDENEVLNRYLVRIKTNMTLLESTDKKNSISIPLKN